jgi:uncharacterized protein YraI
MARGRKVKQIEPSVASMTTTKKIEFFVQMFGWNEQQILQSIAHENPTIIEDAHMRHQSIPKQVFGFKGRADGCR